MTKLNNIANGWAKHLGLTEVSETVKQIAISRVNVCVSCPYAKEHWLSKIVDGILKNDEVGSGIGCTICKCPINQKALVENEKCPKNKW